MSPNILRSALACQVKALFVHAFSNHTSVECSKFLLWQAKGEDGPFHIMAMYIYDTYGSDEHIKYALKCTDGMFNELQWIRFQNQYC